MHAPVFTVRDQDNRKIPYSGMFARFADDESTDLSLAPGQSVSVEIDLADYYVLDQEGIYTVEWAYGESNQAVTKIANTYGDTHNYRRMRGASATCASEVEVDKQFTSKITFSEQCCSGEYMGSRKSIVTAEGVVGGYLQARDTYECLESGACRDNFTKWFGGEHGNIDSTVTANFDQIQRQMREGFSVTCDPPGCASNVYAYVYPTDPTFTVYVCGLFWTIPEERAETLTHEISHFNAVAATDDYQYGYSQCQDLARLNPTNARRNADNYCFMGRDTRAFVPRL